MVRRETPNICCYCNIYFHKTVCFVGSPVDATFLLGKWSELVDADKSGDGFSGFAPRKWQRAGVGLRLPPDCLPAIFAGCGQYPPAKLPSQGPHEG